MITTGLNHAAWHTVSLKGNLPRYSGKWDSEGRMAGCVFATWKSILEYMGLNEFANKINIIPEGSTLDAVSGKEGFKTRRIAEPEFVKLALSKNIPVAMEYLPVGSDRGHAVAIQSVSSRGDRYKFQVMDPDTGSFKTLELGDKQTGTYRIVVK